VTAGRANVPAAIYFFSVKAAGACIGDMHDPSGILRGARPIMLEHECLTAVTAAYWQFSQHAFLPTVHQARSTAVGKSPEVWLDRNLFT